MYQTRAYDRPTVDGFPPEPVVVVVAEGTHDVSRLLNALVRGNTETGKVAEMLRRKVNRHYGGRAALALLKRHGGPDLPLAAPDATDDQGAFWAVPSGAAVTAQPTGDIKVTSHHGSLRMDLEEARQLADRLWAAADHAERAKAGKVLSGPLGTWKACTDPEHTAPVDDTLETCPEHDVPLTTVTAGGYEVVK